MKRLILVVMSSFLLSGFFSGCDDDTSARLARLRVFHDSPDTTPVDVLLDDFVVIRDLGYLESSGYRKIGAGDWRLRTNTAGTEVTLIDTDIFLKRDRDFTAIVIGFSDSIDLLFLEDDNSPPAEGEARVRVVQGAPSFPQEVDVYLTSSDVDIETVNPTLTGLQFKDVSDYLEVPQGEYRIRVTIVGTKEVLMDSGAFILDSGDIRTAVIVDNQGGGPPFDVALLEDSEEAL